MSDKIDRLSAYKKNVKSSKFLYGVSACHFANLTYKGALQEKIRLGKELVKSLLEEDDWVTNQRIEHILKAIEFNNFLLDEIKKCKGN